MDWDGDGHARPAAIDGVVLVLPADSLVADHPDAVRERVAALLERTGAAVALCDVARLRPDLVTVDLLARLRLLALRHGCALRLSRASAELRDLLRLAGLEDVLPG